MARFKDTNYCQTRMLLPISLERQIIPEAFEHSLTYLIDRELELSMFHPRYHSDDNGPGLRAGHLAEDRFVGR